MFQAILHKRHSIIFELGQATVLSQIPEKRQLRKPLRKKIEQEEFPDPIAAGGHLQSVWPQMASQHGVLPLLLFILKYSHFSLWPKIFFQYEYLP